MWVVAHNRCQDIFRLRHLKHRNAVGKPLPPDILILCLTSRGERASTKNIGEEKRFIFSSLRSGCPFSPWPALPSSALQATSGMKYNKGHALVPLRLPSVLLQGWLFLCLFRAHTFSRTFLGPCDPKTLLCNPRFAHLWSIIIWKKCFNKDRKPGVSEKICVHITVFLSKHVNVILLVSENNTDAT